MHRASVPTQHVRRLAILIITALFITACGGLIAPAATATPLPTATLTPSPKPTATLRPTSTPIPTPAKVGDVVVHEDLEITVLKSTTHDLIVPGGLYYYYPSDRSNRFLDIGVLVRQLTGNAGNGLQWNDVQIRDTAGRSSPGFGDFVAVEKGKTVDPFTIGINTQVIDAAPFPLDGDTYFRLIYVVAQHQVVEFTIGDSPVIEITVP